MTAETLLIAAAIGIAVFLLMLWIVRRSGGSNRRLGDADPLAEADVYLAYGQKKKAIEILQHARIAHPDRTDIATKLNELGPKP